MKAIPKDEFLLLIKSNSNKILYKDSILSLFDKYGDDYYSDYGTIRFELCNKNSLRDQKLKDIKEVEQNA